MSLAGEASAFRSGTHAEPRESLSGVASRRGALFLAADTLGLLVAAAVTFGVPLVEPDPRLAVVPALWFGGAWSVGLYSAGATTRRVVQLSIFVSWVVLLFSSGAAIERAEAVAATAVLASAVLVARAGTARLAGSDRVLVVGAGPAGQLVAAKLMRSARRDDVVAGFVDSAPRRRSPALEAVPTLGRLDDLPELVAANRITRVVFADPLDAESSVDQAMSTLVDRGAEVDVVPRDYELLTGGVEVRSAEDVPLLAVRRRRLGPVRRAAKRAIDLVLVVPALAVALPVMAAIAVLIRIDSPGPVFFHQRRLGLAMREFTILKFRTMACDTDGEEHRRYVEATMSPTDAVPQANNLFKLSREREVTRVGRWLRKTSLDELPQLLNVLRGEMSLVGPRPCIPYEVEHYAPRHFERFQVPAGVTGLWQVTARARCTYGEALDLDVAYVRSQSLLGDLLLLARTPLALLRPGATT